MTRYEEMWETGAAKKAVRINWDPKDKDLLDSDSVTFKSIDDLDIGEKYLVSYSRPDIIPISEIVWVSHANVFGKKYIWLLDSSGIPRLIWLKEADNFDTIVKMLLERNKKLIYGVNEQLNALLDHDRKKFAELVAEHPNEDAANIQVDSTELPVKETITVPDPVAKLPQSTVDSMHQKIEYIISLSKKLAETDKKCYVEFSEPLDENGRSKIVEWCKENGVYLPEPYMILLSHANSFLVDFNSAKVGYFTFDSFNTEESPKDKYQRTKEELLERNYDSYINCKRHFGSLAYIGFHYNPYTGEMFFEKTGGFGWEDKFIPIKDFEKEVLDKVIDYLEKNERKGKVLKDASKNPMKKYYDKLLAYIDERDDPDMAVYAPLTSKEITAWEKSHDIKLPKDYKNWLMLSDGGEFADKLIYKLNELDTENPATDPASGKKYIIIASLSGASDCLVFDPQSKEMYILTDDGKCKAGDFVFHVFNEGFKELDEIDE